VEIGGGWNCSELSPVAGFGIKNIDPLGSATGLFMLHIVAKKFNAV
jgi:hypothetical protein